MCRYLLEIPSRMCLNEYLFSRILIIFQSFFFIFVLFCFLGNINLGSERANTFVNTPESILKTLPDYSDVQLFSG